MSDNQKEIKALLVDDEPQLLDILKKVVEIIGAKPLCALDGEEAYTIFLKEHPDIVITDIYMPKMNGINLLRKVKKANPDEPVILITGYAHYKQLIATLETDPDGFLEKPFDLKKIIEMILHFFPELSKK